MTNRGIAIGVVAAAVLVVGACSSEGSGTDTGSSPTGSSRPATSAPGTTTVGTTPATTVASSSSTTAVPSEPLPTATISSDQAVEAAFRQGLAKADAGWIVSNDLTLFQTDDSFAVLARNEQAIPEDLLAEGFDHIGDIDVEGGTIYAPLEQGDYDAMRQLMVRYDAATLERLDVVEVAQSHNAWVSVDPDAMIAYSMSGFTDDVVLRYDVAAGWAPLDPIRLDRTVERVQGGDVERGFLWLATDDATNGVYRVDLTSGAVVDLGTAGQVDGEGEGIDATEVPTGDLHVLVADPALVPMWVVHLLVE
jgi:hypothetical protein